LKTKQSLFNPLTVILICLILDFLGLGLILPVLNNYFKDHSAGLFSPETNEAHRNAMYLISYGLFFLGTFFGAPVIGAMCDKFGRRKMILFTAISTTLSTTIVLLAIFTDNIVLVYIGRLIAGLFSGMLIVLQSSIADVSTFNNKAKNFGLIGIAFGVGFSLGPILGSVLSDAKINSYFGYYLPYALATLINLVNVLFIYLFFKETLDTSKTVSINYFKGFANIQNAYKNLSLRTIFIIIFILATGFSLYLQNFQSLLIDIYKLSKLEIGLALLYVGLWIALAQGLILRGLLKYFKPWQILQFSIPLMGVSFLLLLLTKSTFSFFCLVPFLCMSQGCTFPNTLSIISNNTPSESQGEALSINQSVQSLASSMPLLLAYLASHYQSFTLLFGATCSFLAYAIYMSKLKMYRTD
jgi:DHA1 family tetracycline resistance protein-like MFS transporter